MSNQIWICTITIISNFYIQTVCCGSVLSDVWFTENILSKIPNVYMFGTIERDCFVLITNVPLQRVLINSKVNALPFINSGIPFDGL